MLIDWFTVIAQVFNFLVLVALLKWLLYDRVLKVINQRQQRIADDLAEAEDKRQQAGKQQEEYRRKQEELDSRREQLKQEARAEAKQLRSRLEAEARDDIEQRRQRWEESLSQQQDSFITDLRQSAARQLEQAARHVLASLADAELEQQVVTVFVRRINSLGEEEIEELAGQVAGNGAKAKVSTAFELSDDQRERISGALRDKIRGLQGVEFTRDSDLVCGIEASLGGLAVSWNVDSYLDEFAAVLKQKVSTAGSAGANGDGGDE